MRDRGNCGHAHRDLDAARSEQLLKLADPLLRIGEPAPHHAQTV